MLVQQDNQQPPVANADLGAAFGTRWNAAPSGLCLRASMIDVPDSYIKILMSKENTSENVHEARR